MKDQDNRRYPIGPFEYGQTYSFDDTRKHIRALDRFPKELKKITKKLRGNDLDKPYRADGWTARQVIHHIADSHMNAYIRMKLAVTENTPIIKPYEENLWAETEDGLHGPVKMSLKLLSALHLRWVSFLESLSEEDLERGYYNPASKRTVQMQEAIALYVWHSEHHLHHIRLLTDGKTKSEPAPTADIDIRTTIGVAETPKRRGPKPKTAALPSVADTTPKKRGMSEEHKAKIRAAHEARRLAKAGQAPAALPETGKRTRRTKAQMAADRAEASPASSKKTASGPKAAATTSPSYGIRERGIKGAKAAPASVPGKRIRRTKEQIALDNAAKSAEAPVKRKAGRPAQPKVAAANAAAAPAKRSRRTKEQMAADRASAAAAPTVKRKPGRPAQPKAEKASSEAPKKRGMSAEHMAKIREARMAKRAEAVASGAITPKPKAAKPADNGEPKKRGMSAEHMAKIREARMAKRAAAGLPVAAAKPKAEKTEASDGAPKKRGMSAEHMAKIREARMAKRAATGAATTAPAAPKAKKETPATEEGAPKKRGMSPEHMAKIREARMAKRAATGATTTAPAAPKAKKEKPASEDGAPKKRGMSAEHMAKIREMRNAKKS